MDLISWQAYVLGISKTDVRYLLNSNSNKSLCDLRLFGANCTFVCCVGFVQNSTALHSSRGPGLLPIHLTVTRKQLAGHAKVRAYMHEYI